MKSKRAKFIFRATILIWGFLVITGTAIFMRYENTPGISASTSSVWPVDSRIELASDRPTLILLAHPRCPCTRASIHELSRIAAILENRILIYVIFIKPAEVETDWVKTNLWETASSIPGVRLITDVKGAEAKRFDSYTSGQTVLYDNDGKQLFSGGITSMRGQEGDSLGADAIVSLVNGAGSQVEDTHVYGCSLFADENGEAFKKGDGNTNAER